VFSYDSFRQKNIERGREKTVLGGRNWRCSEAGRRAGRTVDEPLDEPTRRATDVNVDWLNGCDDDACGNS
jgi:hypothetical protein